MIKPLLYGEKIKSVNFKITEDYYIALKSLANQQTNGNVSAWIRNAIAKDKMRSPRRQKIA